MHFGLCKQYLNTFNLQKNKMTVFLRHFKKENDNLTSKTWIPYFLKINVLWTKLKFPWTLPILTATPNLSQLYCPPPNLCCALGMGSFEPLKIYLHTYTATENIVYSIVLNKDITCTHLSTTCYCHLTLCFWNLSMLM